MHLADGVLSVPTLGVATAAAAIGLGLGLRRLSAENLPLAALFAAVFFIIGTVHIPIGIGSVHLVLNGLIGVLLGWLAFPVIFVALSLQALLFSFGGFAVLGANTLLLAAPAVLAHLLLRSSLTQPTWLTGVFAASLGLGGAVALAALMLWSSGGRALADLIGLIAIAQLPAWLIDAVVSALVLTTLARVFPKALALHK